MNRKKKINLAKSFLLTITIIVALITMVIRWDDIWSKVFGSLFNFIFSLTEIIGWICIIFVVCCIVLVITALIYEHFFGDEESERL